MNWVGVLLVVLSIGQDVLCKTKCSVTFYWTEEGQDRVDKMRTYGLLEEKLEILTQEYTPPIKIHSKK